MYEKTAQVHWQGERFQKENESMIENEVSHHGVAREAEAHRSTRRNKVREKKSERIREQRHPGRADNAEKKKKKKTKTAVVVLAAVRSQKRCTERHGVRTQARNVDVARRGDGKSETKF